CMQLWLKADAARTPVHDGAGCGGRQRSAPSGGAAYGMPLNTTMAGSSPATPESAPDSTLTVARSEAGAALGVPGGSAEALEHATARAKQDRLEELARDSFCMRHCWHRTPAEGA